jgi:hypothetical protein
VGGRGGSEEGWWDLGASAVELEEKEGKVSSRSYHGRRQNPGELGIVGFRVRAVESPSGLYFFVEKVVGLCLKGE